MQNNKYGNVNQLIAWCFFVYGTDLLYFNFISMITCIVTINLHTKEIESILDCVMAINFNNRIGTDVHWAREICSLMVSLNMKLLWLRLTLLKCWYCFQFDLKNLLIHNFLGSGVHFNSVYINAHVKADPTNRSRLLKWCYWTLEILKSEINLRTAAAEIVSRLLIELLLLFSSI